VIDMIVVGAVTNLTVDPIYADVADMALVTGGRYLRQHRTKTGAGKPLREQPEARGEPPWQRVCTLQFRTALLRQPMVF
jgi:hypothetical protein